MKPYLAIVDVAGGRLAKYQDFATEGDAAAHVATYGGFVYHNSAGIFVKDLWIAGQTVTVQDRRDLGNERQKAQRQIEAKAEQKRLEYITPGVGQAMTYLEKRDQAEEVIAQGEDVANAMSYEEARQAFPTLAATIGVDAPTLWEVAQLVMQKAHIWANKSFEIEILRANAKKKINEAGTVEEVKAAYDAIDWDAI